MNKSTIVSAIKYVLENQLQTPGLESFSENSRLNEDLYLDSILVLQLLVNLESNLGISIPDDALNAEDFHTVSSLANFLLARKNGGAASSDNPAEEPLPQEKNGEQEEFLDIKVHCFVSCLGEIIKADPRVDHRPFYFGVWDADVIIDDRHYLNYHSPNINHDFFRTWYKKLYGVNVTPWYNSELNKQSNIETLINMLDNKTASQTIMVMLDMFRLPERENKFNQNPFPHYVLLEKTEDPDTWFMSDPDFRWEGTQEKKQVLHAIESEAVAGGYYFDSQEIRTTAKTDIYAYFFTCLDTQSNPMTDCVAKIVNHFTTAATASESRYQHLREALKQLPVLSIRKYAYEHGFAYFWRELKLDDAAFEQWCDVIEELVNTYKKIHFRAIKLSQTSTSTQVETELITELHQFLQQQNEREFKIKQGLLKVFNQWCEKNNFAPFDKSNTAEFKAAEMKVKGASL